MKKLLMIAALALLATGCTDYRTVPLSKVGMVIDKTGVSEDILQPGNYDIGYQRKVTKTLALLDTSVETIPLRLKLRLADDQELDVELLVKTRVDTTNTDTLKAMFGMITPDKIGDYTVNLPLIKIYSKLGQDLVRRSMTEVITPHTLESFRKQRKDINDTIEKLVNQRFKSTPLVLLSATINSVKYPAVYMKTADDIKQLEMSKIKFAKAEQAKREKLLEEEKSILVDQRVRLAKAETVRLENLKTAAGLNPMLLEYRKLELEELRLKVDMEMAKNASNKSTIFYPVGQKPDYVETTLSRK